jgi:hypothetical protein
MLHPKNQTIKEIIHAQSAEADIVSLGLDPPRKDEDMTPYAQRFFDLSEPPRTVFFVKNASLFVGRLIQTLEETPSTEDDREPSPGKTG